MGFDCELCYRDWAGQPTWLDLELPLSQTYHPGGLTFKNSGSVWPLYHFSSFNYHYFRCQQEHVYILLLH